MATELALHPLGVADVGRYLDHRFPRHTFPGVLADLVHERTAGHPLSISDEIHELIARGVVAETDGIWTFRGDVGAIRAMTPVTIHQRVVRQREIFSLDDQRLLEAASIAGAEFCAAAVAAALGTPVVDVEQRCHALATRWNVLRFVGSEEWPDGTHSMRFAFLHALHQEAWREHISAARAEEWHLRIARRREAGYGDRTPEIATSLADQFERGRDHARAIVYREHAGPRAMQRAAHAEARAHLTRAIELLPGLADTAERRRVMLRL